MDAPFVYDRFVTGKNFIARKTECNSLRNLLEHRENICIYEPPKSGKMSLIQQTLFNMRMAGRQYLAPGVSLFNVRNTARFLTKLGSAVIRQAASTPAEYEDAVRNMLAGTHFTFDQERFSCCDEILTLTDEPDENDIRKILSLPEAVAEKADTDVFVILEEFQDLLSLGETESERIFRIMQEMFTGRDRTGEHFVGKVIDQELLSGAVELFKGNIWYISHFAAVCDSLSKGFMNEGTMMDALAMVLSVHEVRFKAMTDDLTVHQLSLLKAILDGETRFSSVEVVEKYALNSSANVRRVKDALKKKEIITFNEKDEPYFLDPLFEYWLEKYYFER